ncbi:MAG: hypothetical protein QOH31_1958 [Verrucomicrobiota bacterium]|jgi:hypothetical protein
MSSAARLLERTRINKSVREFDDENEFEIPADAATLQLLAE